MLTTVIDNVVLPKAETFVKEMGKAGRRAERDKYVNIDDVAKQTIYTSTLQLKAYFSLLEDISTMYSQVDRQYIKGGMDLCLELSKGTSSNKSMEQWSQELATFSQDSAKAVAALVDAVWISSFSIHRLLIDEFLFFLISNIVCRRSLTALKHRNNKRFSEV